MVMRMNPMLRAAALAMALFALGLGPQPATACDGEGCLREVQNGGYTCIIRNSDNALLRCAETSAGSGGTAL